MKPMEKWLPVHGYEGLYEVSSEGRVRSLDRIVGNSSKSFLRTREYAGRILEVAKGREPRVTLAKLGTTQRLTIKRLMAEHFPIPSTTPDTLPGEEWRPVPGYLGLYEVSSEGRVRSLDRLLALDAIKQRSRTVTGRVLTALRLSKGYMGVHLLNNGHSRTLKVHRLVAEVFIPNPRGLPQVNHRDFNKANNRVSNLEWCTGLQNMHHAKYNQLNGRHGRLSRTEVNDIRALGKQGVIVSELAQRFAVSEESIRLILRGVTW